jgi:hypothetical protein
MRPFALLPLLALAGCAASDATFDYDKLRGGMSIAEVRHLPPDQALTCLLPNSGRGVGKCEVPLTKMDGLKAAKLTYYFMDEKLEAASVEYSPGAYAEVSKMMDARYKRFDENTSTHGTWKVADGAVISSSTDLKNGNVYTYWLSAAGMEKERRAH